MWWLLCPHNAMNYTVSSLHVERLLIIYIRKVMQNHQVTVFLHHAGATRFRSSRPQGTLAASCHYGRAECGPTKIRGVGSPVRSGAETAYTSIDGWPKASGSPTSSVPFPQQTPKMTSGPAKRAATQRKTGRGAGQSPDVQSRRAAPGSFTPSAQSDSDLPHALEDSDIKALIQFFQTLDRWDREAHGPQVM